MADIPINPVTRRVEFTGNTGTGPFAFTFNVLAQADVAAYKNNTLLALTSDYTVSLNSNGTGSITLTSALIATDELVIIGDLALSRTTDFVTAGDLLASSLNEQFDSNVVMSQQLDERFDRTIRSQPGDINKNLYLPLVSSRASQLLSFDSSGNITTTSLSNVPDIGTVNLTVSGVASFADGSASAPSITNIGDTNTGMYFGAADQINFSVGGSEVISVASTGTTISGLSISSGDILLTDNSATALEIKEGSNNYLTFITTNGSEKISFGSTANPTFEVNGSFRQPLIAATTSFFSQTYSGATLSATNGSVNIESYSASKAGIVLNGSGDQITFTSPTLGFVGLVQVVGAITTNTSLNIASSTTVDGILDEDNMASNSATKLATQQSIKAYVDAQVGTVDTLAEVLGNGNTTGGTNIVVSANDVISLDDGTNALPSLTTTGDLNTGIYFPAADEVGITTGGTQRVKVDSTGVNVTGTVTGTGTSVFASLDISGDIDVDGTTNLDVVDIDGAVDMASTLNVSGITDFGSYQGSSVNSPVNVKSDSNHFAISLEENSGTETWQLGIDADGDLNFHNSGNATPSVTFNDGGIVGIGVADLSTWSLGKALHIGVKENNLWGEADYAFHMNQNAYYNGGWKYTHTDEATRYSQEDGKHTWHYAASGTANAAISWSEAMRINSSGNVGIGASSPSQKLHVSGGNLQLVNGSSTLYLGDGPNLVTSAPTSSSAIRFDSDNLLFSYSNNERMRIDSSGNVGIGTSSPASQLHLEQETSNTTTRSDQVRVVAKSSGTTGVGFGADILFTGERTSGTLQAMGRIGFGASTNTSSNLSSDFIVETASSGVPSEAMRIDSSGNVGIATTGPATLGGGAKLTVNQAADGNIVFARGGSTRQVQLGTTSTTGYINADNTSGGLAFHMNGSEAMRITSASDLIIASTGGTLQTATAGTSNFRAGVNAGNSIASGGNYNTVVGDEAGTAINTGDQNTALGYGAGASITTAGNNVLVGYKSGYYGVTATQVTGLGSNTLVSNIGSYNTGLGYGAMFANTSGANNTAVGVEALVSNLTADNNTAVGYQAGYSNTTGTNNVALGKDTLRNVNTTSNNTAVGNGAGYTTTGEYNTFLGRSSGGNITTGSKNTIIGSYTGNSGGLDIRTSSNNIVLSDGDGNPRMFVDSGGKAVFGSSINGSQSAGDGVKLPEHGACWVVNDGSTGGGDGFSYYNGTAGAYRFYVSNAGQIFATNTSISAISDQRMKENVRDLDVGLDEVLALRPRTFDWKSGWGKDQVNDRGFIAQEVEQVFPDLIDEWKDASPEGEEPYKSVRQDLIPVLVKAIQELSAKNDALEARITALESA